MAYPCTQCKMVAPIHQNTKICCGLFWIGFHPADWRQCSGSPALDLQVTSPIITGSPSLDIYTTALFTTYAQHYYAKTGVPDVHNTETFNCPYLYDVHIVCVCVCVFTPCTGDEVKLYSFLNWTPDKHEWSTAHPSFFTRKEEPQNPDTHSIWGWVGPRGGLDTFEKKKWWPYCDLDTGPSSP